VFKIFTAITFAPPLGVMTPHLQKKTISDDAIAKTMDINPNGQMLLGV